jgi:hypothetical protein
MKVVRDPQMLTLFVGPFVVAFQWSRKSYGFGHSGRFRRWWSGVRRWDRA